MGILKWLYIVLESKLIYVCFLRISCPQDPKTNFETTNPNFAIVIFVRNTLIGSEKFVKNQDSQFRDWLLDSLSKISMHYLWRQIFFAELFCKNISLVNVESANGQRQLSAWLGALLNFTATTTWNVFQKPAFSKLAPGMEKLCQAFLSHLLTGKQNSYIGYSSNQFIF